MTKMNMRTGKRRDTSPGVYRQGKEVRRIRDQDKVHIASEYEHRCEEGELGQQVIVGLARRYHRDVRTIWRYIRQGKEIIKSEQVAPLVYASEQKQHNKDLRQCGERILLNVRKLLEYQRVDVQGCPNAIDGGVIRSEQGNSEDDLDLVNEHLATQVLVHFKQRFPKTRVGGSNQWTWRSVTNRSADTILIGQLEIFVSEPLEHCRQCPVCVKIRNPK